MINNRMAQAWLLGRPITAEVIANKPRPPEVKERPRISRRGLSMEDNGRWAVTVEFEGMKYRIGSYSTPPTAAKARDRADIQIEAGVFDPSITMTPKKPRQYPARIVLGGQLHYLGKYATRAESNRVCQEFKDNYLDRKYAIRHT